MATWPPSSHQIGDTPLQACGPTSPLQCVTSRETGGGSAGNGTPDKGKGPLSGSGMTETDEPVPSAPVRAAGEAGDMSHEKPG
jgi:hypothetical protein